jgi:uncharacterized protein (DUF2141 family)
MGSIVRDRPRSVALALGTIALVGAVPPAQPGADVTIVAKHLRNDRGVVRACLTGQAERFPNCDDKSRSFQVVGEAADTVTLVFRDVPPGRYAVALLHDENGNGKADRAAMMIPTEGFGFSRDAKVRFGPPRFGEAAFDVAAGTNERLVIKMRYLL